MNVMYVASDNCLSSGAFKSMVKLCELERDIYNINPIVVLPYYGDGEELLKSAKLNYVYVKSEDWIVSNISESSKEFIKKRIKVLLNFFSIIKLEHLIKEKNIKIVKKILIQFINLIKYFVSVAQNLNFSETARQNFVSQSTVSRGIKEMEKELGASLFSRTKRNVVLTPEGKALLPYAMEIIENLNSATFIIDKLQKGIDGKLTVGYDETSGPYISKYLQGFVAKYPDITVDIKKIQVSEEILALDNNEYDIVFMLRDMMPDSPDIDHLDAYDDTLSVISKKGLLAGGGIDFDQLHQQNIVLLSEVISPILYMEILDLFRTYNIIPNIVNRYDDVRSVITAVSAGIGISILPTSLCRAMFNSQFEIHRIKGIDTSISYIMTWNKAMRNPGTKLFLKEASKVNVEDV